MLKTDYLITGLDEASLELTIKGTNHFMNNLVSGWYSLEEVLLTPGGKVKLLFCPNEEIATLFPAREYSITLYANESFSLVEKEIYSTEEKSTVKYVFLNCHINDQEQPYFHYEILQKKMDAPIADDDKRIHMYMTPEQLISEGFSRIKNVDDQSRVGNMVVLENRRKAS